MSLFLGIELTTWLVGAAVAIAIFYWSKFKSPHHFWRSKNVPSDKPKMFGARLGSLLSGKTIWQLDKEQMQKHGKVCGIYYGLTPMLLVSDPDLIKTILVKDFQRFHDKKIFPSKHLIIRNSLTTAEGEAWKRLRTIVSPIFTTSKLRKLVVLVNKSCDGLSESLQTFADSNLPVDFKKVYEGFAVDVIASTVFGVDMEATTNPNENIFVIHARKALTNNFSWKVPLFVLAPKVMRKLGIGLFDPKGFAFLMELVLKVREERTTGGKVRQDFLQMLIDIESATTEGKDSQEENYYGAEGGTIGLFLRHNFKKSLNSDELISQCVTFLMGGYETVSTTLALISYLLALNPECQNRLVEEVDQTWDKHEEIDYEAVNNMKYLDAVIAEGLRLYPPGTRLTRRCVEEHILGNTGITIPKGMFVNIPIYVMHRDPEYFPEPEAFKPERFLPENKDSIKPYTYLPFGSGPRNCVAMRFALMEMKLCIFHVLRNVTFHKCEETHIPMQYLAYSGLDTIRPKAVTLRVKRRR